MTNSLNEVINKFYWYDLQDKVSILVYAEEAKSVYGRTDILIAPVFGTGRFWKSLDKLRLVGTTYIPISTTSLRIENNNLILNGELTNV